MVHAQEREGRERKESVPVRGMGRKGARDGTHEGSRYAELYGEYIRRDRIVIPRPLFVRIPGRVAVTANHRTFTLLWLPLCIHRCKTRHAKRADAYWMRFNLFRRNTTFVHEGPKTFDGGDEVDNPSKHPTVGIPATVHGSG